MVMESQVSIVNSHIQPYSYRAELARSIESKWQKRWEAQGSFYAPNCDGDLAGTVSVPKLFVMDMFPYPSGVGLHVGHPLGFIATDVYARYHRMLGFTVLHTMGFDAFGLPAEQYAIQEGLHPQITTEKNIDNFLNQITMIGLGHDSRRRVSTTEIDFYRWTQWIFSRIYDAWFDSELHKARPIAELIHELESGVRKMEDGRDYTALTAKEKADYLNTQRLAYLGEAIVNWCPGLGTVLSAEEVTSEGKSERGNFPVFRKSMRQWMMRITSYAPRLLEDLQYLDWPEKVLTMQRNWIGESVGAVIRFPLLQSDTIWEVFTSRPDTLYGVSYIVIAPEHPQLMENLPTDWPENTPAAWRTADTPRTAVQAYIAHIENKSELQRRENKEKSGQFTGIYVQHPLTDEPIPVFVADYVLAGYGTGIVMGVPAHDQRDYEFAELCDLAKPVVIAGAPEPLTEAYSASGVLINSGKYNGLTSEEAKIAIIADLSVENKAYPHKEYRLRDWVFARQRYWGEPFPIVYDAEDIPHLLPDSYLPLELPPTSDFNPISYDAEDAESLPTPPLSKLQDWVNVTLDLGDGPRQYRRETNTMPNWAGSCSYYLRYIDPHNTQDIASTANEQFWMQGQNATAQIGGVDLYIGGVEHAVLHLLYSRFWHKILFDLGYVSTIEPFHKLFNQGMIQAHAYTDKRGIYIPAEEVEEREGKFFYQGEEVHQEFGRMGKSLKNAVSPNEICHGWGADTFRVYEMSLGPLDQSTTWTTKDIIGSHRFLQRLWRTMISEETGHSIVTDNTPDTALLKILAHTIQGVREDYANLRFNTAVAKLIQLTNYLTKHYPQGAPREAAETLILLVAPLAPHIAAELWEKLGHTDDIVHAAFPIVDNQYLVKDEIEIPIQIGGKVRARIHVTPGLTKEQLQDLALQNEKIQKLLITEPKKIIVVPEKLVNIVL